MSFPSLLVAGILFFVLSPGVFLTIPPSKGGLFFSCQTSLLAALVHAVVFIAVTYLLTSVVEGFSGNPLKCKGPNGSSCNYGIPGMNTGTCCNNKCMDYIDGKCP